MDSSPAPSFPPPGGLAAPIARPARSPVARPCSTGFSPAEEALLTVLLKKGLLTTEQVRDGPGLWPGAQSRPPPVDPRAQSDLTRSAQPAGLRAAQRALPADNGQIAQRRRQVAVCRRCRSHPIAPSITATSARTCRKRPAPRRLSELVNQILERACDCQATDIHFDPQENGLRVRYRIDGQLQDILFVEPAMATPVISRLKVISNLNIVERRHSQDGRITIMHHNRPRDLRVATVPDALRREDRDPDPRGADRRQGFHPSGHDRRAGRDARQADRPALWGRPGRRPGRRRQDLDPLQLPGADQLAAQERDDDRRPDRAPDPRASTRPRSTLKATWASARGCGPCSARTPTSS